jgi:Flp pilus assembly protein TadG
LSFAPIVSFKGDQRGGVAVVLGFALPVLLLSGSAALDTATLLRAVLRFRRLLTGRLSPVLAN